MFLNYCKNYNHYFKIIISFFKIKILKKKNDVQPYCVLIYKLKISNIYFNISNNKAVLKMSNVSFLDNQLIRWIQKIWVRYPHNQLCRICVEIFFLNFIFRSTYNLYE